MSLQYRILYRLGITPWEQMATLPVREQLIGLFEREERDRDGSPGTALDLGCGRGIWAAELAPIPTDVSGAPAAVRNAEPRLFRLRRNPADASALDL